MERADAGRVMKTQSIKAFLETYTHADLAALYNHDMECQVTVAKGEGERVEKDFKGKQYQVYTDGIQTWKPFRIPMFSNTEPEYEDVPMGFDLKEHAEGIGMTGWDWAQRTSRWVAFDFDAITGHSDKHAKRLSDSELTHIREALTNIPTVTIRKSTGGRGLHIYVFLEPIYTANHNEHASVARAVLSHLSAIAGFDFTIKVDTCGGNMWVWHTKLAGTDGLTLLKSGTELAKVPSNWRDYTKVITGRRTKNIPSFIEEQQGIHTDIDDVFAELTGQRVRQKLDDEHKKLLMYLVERDASAAWWDAEHHMLVTHTALLKEAHTALGLKGKFETITSRGSLVNCYAFPMPKGVWTIRRYTLGVAEHAYWNQDGQGWTNTIYNREPTLEQACRLQGAIEDDKGNYWFATGEQAQEAALLLGANLDLPPYARSSKTKVKLQKTSGKLVVVLEKSADMPSIPGWLTEGKKITKLFDIKTPPPNQVDMSKTDDTVRHLVTENGDDCGWVLRTDNEWHQEPVDNIKVALRIHYSGPEMLTILGNSVLQCWKLVSIPFKEEYPRDRQWNRFSAQLRFQPSINRDNLKYPTWMKILDHWGQGLNEAVAKNEWCMGNGIISGADWLKCWLASLFQEPMEPLPYLFAYGPENTGKSFFYEALTLLMTPGSVCRADAAITSQGGFNGELEGAVLCVVEETDLRKNVTALNKIKDWVTSRLLTIHKKHKQPYLIPNVTHYIQTSNSHNACPIFPGDTRITMILVDTIPEDQKIPKKQLFPMLEAEAPDFIAELLSLELPKSNDRLNIPCITTADKEKIQQFNMSSVERFIDETSMYAPGHMVEFAVFYDRFIEWIDASESKEWSKHKLKKELPPKFVMGRSARHSAKHFIGNISFDKIEETSFTERLVLHEGWLKPCSQVPNPLSRNSVATSHSDTKNGSEKTPVPNSQSHT